MIALLSLLTSLAFASPAAHADTISIDGKGAARPFLGDGYLVVSGEGRYLRDYPKAQRAQMLDLLFCSPDPANRPRPGYCQSGRHGAPVYGAATQVLKVEIAGDQNNSIGSEPSFLHTRAEFDALNARGPSAATCHFDRGFLWWIMREARKRNPNIILTTGVWTLPAWAAYGDSPTPLNDLYRQYLIDFAKCAAINGDSHVSGTPLQYIGADWNEAYLDQQDEAGWVADFKRAIVEQMGSHAPKIVCCDALAWQPMLSDLASNQAFSDAVDVLGIHYTYSPPPSQPRQPTWATEDWNFNIPNPPWPPSDWPNAGGAAQLIDEHHIVDGMSGTLQIRLADAFPDNMTSTGIGGIWGFTPWSGHYRAAPNLWVTAQYMQFTKPGWSFLPDSSCHFGRLAGDCGDRSANASGSYVSFRDPKSHDWSVVAETVNATASRELELCPKHLSARPRALTMAVTSESESFHVSRLARSRGCYSTTLEPGAVYSFSTLTYPKRRLPPRPPEDKPFALPYCENFDGTSAACPADSTQPSSTCERAAAGYRPGETACWLYDEEGVFQIKPHCGDTVPGSSSGKCIEQIVTEMPVVFFPLPSQLFWTHVGPTGEAPTSTTPAWRDYTVSTDVKPEGAAEVHLLARLNDHTRSWPRPGPFEYDDIAGYHLIINPDTGIWRITKGYANPANNTTLASCDDAACAAPFEAGTWHHVQLAVTGTSRAHISACVDGKLLGSVSDGSDPYPNGQIALMTHGGNGMAKFDDLTVTPGAASCSGSG